MAAVSLLQCQVIGGFASYDVVTPDAGGAGGVGGEGGSVSCPLELPPEAPVDASPDESVAFTLAVRKVELGESLTRSLGFDLDEACTCGPEACECAAVATCDRPGIVDPDDWARCDGEGGIDGNSALLYDTFQNFEPLLSSSVVSAAINLGEGTVLIDVRGYNGELDDDRVLVGVYTTGRFIEAECNDGAPLWDGEDHWPIDEDTTLVSHAVCGMRPQPRFFDNKAYVVDGTLVARLSEVRFVLHLGLAALPLRIVDAIAMAPLVQDGAGRWSTKGATLAGRWPVADIFQALGGLDDFTAAQLCDGGLESIQKAVCDTVDVRADGGNEGPCDAVSFGTMFEAQEAKFGNAIEVPVGMTCAALADLDCEGTPQ